LNSPTRIDVTQIDPAGCQTSTEYFRCVLNHLKSKPEPPAAEPN
jgi:hypothetical protein